MITHHDRSRHRINCSYAAVQKLAQYRAPDRAARRLPGHDVRHDRQPLLLVRPADDRHGRAARDERRRRRLRGRRRRVDLVRAERDEQTHAQRSVDPRAQARALLADAADRRVRVEEIRHPAREAGRVRGQESTARGSGPNSGEVQGRNRPRVDHDEGRRQGDRRGIDERRHGVG